MDKKEKFQQIEKSCVKNFVNYRQYGTYGIRMMFESHPFSVFFINSSPVPEMNAFIDSGFRLNIYTSLIGSNMVKRKWFVLSDFSGILLFFLTLLASFYGYEDKNNREYAKTLASLSGPKPAFFSTLLSRIVIIAGFIAFQLGLAILLSALNGVRISPDKHLAAFYILALAVSVIFFLVGRAVGNIRPKIFGVISLFISWFLLLFALPAAVNGIFEVKSANIPPGYDLELKKFKVFIDFEKQAIEDNITYRQGEKLTEAAKKRVLEYWNNEFKNIQEMEREMYREMRSGVRTYQWASIIFPTSFYLSVNEEISSQGYDNLLDFYLYTIDLKAGFVKYYIDKLYFENFSKVVSFIKGEENVYPATPRLPVTFFPGLLLMFFYIFVLLLLNYFLYRRTLFGLIDAGEESEEDLPLAEVKLKMGEARIFQAFGRMLVDRLYNLFSGETREIQKRETPPKVYVNDTDISEKPFNKRLLFLCSPEKLPLDVRVKDFFCFTRDVTRFPEKKSQDLYNSLNLHRIHDKKIGRLRKSEKASLQFAMALMSSSDVYLFYNTVRNATKNITIHFKDLMEKLTGAGKLVLYLSPETAISEHTNEEYNHFYDRTKGWAVMLEAKKN